MQFVCMYEDDEEEDNLKVDGFPHYNADDAFFLGGFCAKTSPAVPTCLIGPNP